MNIQTYLREHFSDKTIILVGNALFHADCSQLIDTHDLVVRFNVFNNPSFQQGMTGSKMHYWCVNLGTGRRKKREREQRDRLCCEVKKRYPGVPVITPCEEDPHQRLADVKTYYPERGLVIIYPDDQLHTGLRKQPSVGYYLAYRLTSLSIPISIIGFTGVTTKWHDGRQENRLLGSNRLVTFHETP